MNGFLQHTAASICERLGWEALRTTTLVLPSQRAGLMLREELLQLQQRSGREAVYAPTVQTLRQFLDSLSPLYAEDELKTIMRLYTLYRKHIASEGDEMPLDQFYGWGKQMIADFTNIDVSMPFSEVESFFKHTVAAHELNEWQLDRDTEDRLRALIKPDAAPVSDDALSIRNQYKTLWRKLYELYLALHQQMLEEHKGYEGMRSRAILDNKAEVEQRLSRRQFVFVGFNYLLPVEREIMELLKDRSLFYWDYVPSFPANTKAFSFARLNQSILGSASEPNTWTAPKSVDVISCPSSAAQAQYVHDWLASAYREKGQHVAVVICDEGMLEPVIYTLPTIRLEGNETPEPINITKGFPLRNTRAFARVIALLDEMQDLTELETLADRLALASEDEMPAEESWHTLLAQEAMFQVRKCINRMRTMITSYPEVPFTVSLVRMLLRRELESVTMPFNGEPVTDLQVLGVLETRVLDFDKILMLNVEEGIIPQKSHDVSFIPFYLRKAYHMQTDDERATVYAYNFFRLLSRTREVTMLFTSAEANPNSRGVSRFVLQMLASDLFDVHKYQLSESSQIEPVTTVEEQIIPFRRNYLSPSAINTYVDCPRKFYWQYVKGLREEEPADAIMPRNELGTMVHAIMQYLYSHYLGCDGSSPKQVLPEQIHALLQSETILSEALDKAYEQSDYIRSEQTMANEAILRYVTHILERDEQDAAHGLFIWQLEKKSRLPLAIVESLGQVYVEGTVDRLDIVGERGQEVLRVIDYKTGKYDEKKLTAMPEELFEDETKSYIRQTLIYSAAVNRTLSPKMKIVPNLFFCTKDMRSLDTGIVVAGEKINDYHTISESFEQQLVSLTQSIYNDQFFAPQTKTETCHAYCPFLLLCGRKPDTDN